MPDRTRHSVAVLSALLSVVLWLYVTWERPVEIDLSVPLRIVNLSGDLAVSGDMPRSAEVTLSGPRLVLAFLSEGRLAGTLNLTRAGEGTISFPHIDKTISLPDNVKVTRISPSGVELTLAKRGGSVPARR